MSKGLPIYWRCPHCNEQGTGNAAAEKHVGGKHFTITSSSPFDTSVD